MAIAEVINICKPNGHEFKDVRAWDPDYYATGVGTMIFAGRICVKCDFFIKARPGDKFHVCHECNDGDMKYAGAEHINGFRVSTYECLLCGHQVKSALCST